MCVFILVNDAFQDVKRRIELSLSVVPSAWQVTVYKTCINGVVLNQDGEDELISIW